MGNCNAHSHRGVAVLRNPWLNRGSAFTQEERDQYGLRGLLPPGVSSISDQVARLKDIIAKQESPLNKYLVLESVHASDEALFFQLVMENVEEYMPLIYTPTVGEACQKISHIFRYKFVNNSFSLVRIVLCSIFDFIFKYAAFRICYIGFFQFFF